MIFPDIFLKQLMFLEQDFFKKAALFVLRALAKHSSEMASSVVAEGGLEAMALCLEDFNPSVKEAAAWGIGYVSRHNNVLAQAAVDVGNDEKRQTKCFFIHEKL